MNEWIKYLVNDLAKSLGEGDGTPLQYSCLENPMDGGAWWAAVHGVARSWTQLSDFTFTFHFHALEKEMATHSSVLAWRTPGTGGAWWAAIYGVAQSQTWLSNLAAKAYEENWEMLKKCMNTRSLQWYLYEHGKNRAMTPTEYIWTCQQKSLNSPNAAENGLQHLALTYQLGKSIWANHCHYFFV